MEVSLQALRIAAEERQTLSKTRESIQCMDRLGFDYLSLVETCICVGGIGRAGEERRAVSRRKCLGGYSGWIS